MWAARIAHACRCAQAVRDVMFVESWPAAIGYAVRSATDCCRRQLANACTWPILVGGHGLGAPQRSTSSEVRGTTCGVPGASSSRTNTGINYSSGRIALLQATTCAADRNKCMCALGQVPAIYRRSRMMKRAAVFQMMLALTGLVLAVTAQGTRAGAFHDGRLVSARTSPELTVAQNGCWQPVSVGHPRAPGCSSPD